MSDWQLALAAVGAMIAVATFFNNVLGKLGTKLDVIKEKIDAKVDALEHLADSKHAQLDQKLDSQRALFETKLEAVRSEESKARHTLGNTCMVNHASVVQRLEGMVSRTEMDKYEARVGGSLERIGSKLDDVQKAVIAIHTMESSMNDLSKRMDRLTNYMDQFMSGRSEIIARSTTGGD